MLLRRITKHVKDQNWFAVLIDFIIVVFGVFIGIQVANWNDQRLTTEQEIIHLQSLRSEFVQSINSASNYIEDADLALDSMMILLRAAQGERPELSIDDFDKHMLEGMFRFGIFSTNVTTLQEMQSSGDLSSIGTPELRLALIDVLNVLETVRDREDDFMHVITNFSDPWLIKKFDLRRIHDQDRAVVSFPKLQGIRPFNDDDPRKLLTDQELNNVLSLRSITQANVRGNIMNLLVEYREALKLIEGRLDVLGASE